jgi:hypothetical protein
LDLFDPLETLAFEAAAAGFGFALAGAGADPEKDFLRLAGTTEAGGSDGFTFAMMT